MKTGSTPYQEIATVRDADRIAEQNGCTHRSRLTGPGGCDLGFCYWVLPAEAPSNKGKEKAVYYRSLKVLDVWEKETPLEELPEDCLPFGEGDKK